LIEYNWWLHPEDALDGPSSLPALAPTGRFNENSIMEWSLAGSALLSLALVGWWSRRTKPRIRQLWETAYFSVGMFCLNFVAVFVVFVISIALRHSR